MNLGHLLAQGGWAMWPIYLCSVIALAVFCQRFVVLFSVRDQALAWLEPFLKDIYSRNFDSAQRILKTTRHPIAYVLLKATQTHLHRPDRVEAEAQRIGELELQRLERFLPLLSFITEVAPLLGLLGTVLGMVTMFFGLQNAGMSQVDVSQLSKGIWQALLTTAAGLIVAAPSLAGHTYLVSRVDRFRLKMRDAVGRLLTALPNQHADPEELELAQPTFVPTPPRQTNDEVL